MHIPTHTLSGWVLANAVSKLDARGRLFCMIAASAADLDGIGFLFGEEAYWRFHHVVGHNVLVGVVSSALLGCFARRGRAITFLACVTCFHLHLLLDFYGSGIGWQIHYLWPFDPSGFKTDAAWPLMSWQNYASFVLLVIATGLIAWRKRRTPLELIAPRLNDKLIRIGPDA